MSRETELVVINTDLHTARVTGSAMKPIWFERRLNSRMHVSECEQARKLYLANELVDHGFAVAFVASCKEALELPAVMQRMCAELDMKLSITVASPQSLTQRVFSKIAEHKRWGSALYRDLPTIS